MSKGTWVGGALLGAAWLACAAGSLWAQAPQARGAAPAAARTVAVVNGEVITAADLDNMLRQAGPTAVQVPDAERRKMQMEALSMLIDEKLMVQFLNKNAPPVSAAEVSQEIAKLAEGQKKLNKTMEDFYRNTNQNEAQLRATLTLLLQWGHYAQARITEADLQRYYQEYRDFFDKVTVRASHIMLRLSPTSSPAEVEEARKKLLALRAQILARQVDFAEAAKKYSQCPLSTSNGGDLGFFPRKWVMDEAFSRAAFALPVGEVSDLVRTEFGLHLIKVVERKPGEKSEYAKIKEDVREFYAEELRQSLLQEQRKTAKIEVHMP